MANTKRIALQSDFLRVVITPVGGRVIFLGRPDGSNVLKVDASLLNGRVCRRPVALHYRFKPWNGHTVWCGPQSAFWTDQDLDPRRRDARAVWPPDPFGEVGWFAVREISPEHVVLEGPPSPVTGLQLTKTVHLTDRGACFIVTARNVRDKSVTRDLWPNTRVDGRARVFVPVAHDGVLRVAGGQHHAESMPYAVVNGFFTFLPTAPSPAVRQRFSKAFLHPSSGRIFAFCGEELLCVRFEVPAREQIHPEQSAVELYNAYDCNGDALLELETHSPCYTLEPGESMTTKLHWTVQRYTGGESDEERIAAVSTLCGE